VNIVKRHGIESAVLLVLVTVVALYVQRSTGPESDWARFFRPATLLFICGQNPHQVPGFYSPTVVLVGLVPLALMGLRISLALLSGLSISIYFYAARSLGASVLVAGLMVSNPIYLIHHLGNPNIDWMVALGYILPASVPSFLLLLAKPQIGLGAALVEGRSNAIKFLATIGVLALTVAIYGPYFFLWTDPVNAEHNWSLFPAGLPVGLAMLCYAIWKRNKGMALIATPLLSPFVGYYSWPIVLLGLLPKHQKVAGFVSGMTTMIILLFLIIEVL